MMIGSSSPYAYVHDQKRCPLKKKFSQGFLLQLKLKFELNIYLNFKKENETGISQLLLSMIHVQSIVFLQQSI
jgi:hypothetical protein